MKATLVFLGLFGLILAGPLGPEIDDPEPQKFIYYEREDGTIGMEDLSSGPIETFASADDVTYYFFSRENTAGVKFTHNEVANLRTRTNFSPTKMTLFIIHGWTNNHGSEVNTYIRSAALSTADINVVVVDWSPVSTRSYLVAQGSVQQLGNFIGAVVAQFNSVLGQDYNLITVAGHSLGAHIAGCTGAATGGRVGTVVGLDPAGPLFTERNINNRIDPTDGVHVKIIHTNDGQFGFDIRMGDVDYYPNGGRSQPGCGLDLTGICAHGRAFYLYAESLRTNNFLSRNCDSYTRFQYGLCFTRATALMGGLFPDTTPRGDYYLTTNRASPFARGTA